MQHALVRQVSFGVGCVAMENMAEILQSSWKSKEKCHKAVSSEDAF
jgi:hypothetical protein